jgi:hypothetical protein
VTTKSLPRTPSIPLLACWSPIAIAGGLHLVGIAADQKRLIGWITTGSILELDFPGRRATASDGAPYELGLRVGGILTPAARRSVAAMMAGGSENEVPACALTTKELSAWAAKVRFIGSQQYLTSLALFEVPTGSGSGQS